MSAGGEQSTRGNAYSGEAKMKTCKYGQYKRGGRGEPLQGKSAIQVAKWG